MEICYLCNGLSGVKKLIHHHLTYEPEQMIILCIKCHSLVHHLARLSLDKRQYIEEIIFKYGNQWSNGNKQYRKTQRYREVHNKNHLENSRRRRRELGIPERKWRTEKDKKEYMKNYYLKNREIILNNTKKYYTENIYRIKVRQHAAYLKRKGEGYYS